MKGSNIFRKREWCNGPPHTHPPASVNINTWLILSHLYPLTFLLSPRVFWTNHIILFLQIFQHVLLNYKDALKNPHNFTTITTSKINENSSISSNTQFIFPQLSNLFFVGLNKVDFSGSIRQFNLFQFLGFPSISLFSPLQFLLVEKIGSRVPQFPTVWILLISSLWGPLTRPSEHCVPYKFVVLYWGLITFSFGFFLARLLHWWWCALHKEVHNVCWSLVLWF